MEIPEKIKRGAKAERKGESSAADPRALNTAKVPQKIMDMLIANPIPYNVPFFPIIKEKGMAINTITRLDNGKAYLLYNWASYLLVSDLFLSR
jgi:hypothetical protein